MNNAPDMTNSNVREICVVLQNNKINNDINISYFTVQRDGMKMWVAGLTQNIWKESRK